MRLVQRIAAVWVAATVGCGSSGAYLGSENVPARVELDPVELFLTFGAERTATLRPPEQSVDDLSAARRSARGSDRRRVLRDLVFAHLFAAEETEDREARRHRRSAGQLATSLARGRDAFLKTEMDFAKLWIAWREERRNVEQLSERFVRRHTGSGDLVLLAWLIRAEDAYRREKWDDAVEAYRFVLGYIDHPLYAYALFRTGEAWGHLGRQDDAQQAFREVRDMGCDDGPEERALVARAAAAKLRTPLVTVGGREIPDTCPAARADD